MCFEHPGFRRGQTEGLGDSEGIRDEIKAKARAALGVRGGTTWEDTEAEERGSPKAA